MKWFYDLKVATKLLVGFVLVALIAGVVGITGIININTINKADQQLYLLNTKPIEQIASASKAYDQIRVVVRDMIIDKTTVNISKNEATIKDNLNTMKSEMEEFSKTLQSEEGKKQTKLLEDTLGEFEPYLENVVALVKANKKDQAYNLMQTKGKELAKNINEPLAKLSDLKVELAKEKADANTETASSSITIMIAFIAIGIVLAIILGVFISRSISKPLAELVVAAGKISDGDLDVNIGVKSKDEVGQLSLAFDKMATNLNEVISNINSSAEQVAAGARQVSASSMALSQGSTEQASSVEEITAAMTQIATQTKQNAINANQANELATQAKENAIQGNSQMQEMVSAMSEINDSSANISKIIKVIDEIAFQTNILALNAAVEAARAGQHGKGFAVVAEEVRNLAARSANAAKETTDMIEGSIKKVEVGTKIANETAEALDKIVDGVAKAANLVGDIADASNEQATGISQVNQAIEQVAQVVQTNSATAEESASASEELSAQAEVLKDSVSSFKLKRSMGTKINSYSMNSDMLRAIEGMMDNQRVAKMEQKAAYQEAASTSNAPRISLDDNDFGKY